MTRRWNTGVVFYGISVVIIAVSLAALFQLLRRFEFDLETNVAALQRVFSDEGVLKNPSDPLISFADIEELADKFEDYGYFGRLTVTKLFGDNERVVYPFYFPALLSDADSSTTTKELAGHPVPANPPRDARKLALESRGQTLGYLYVRLREGPLETVRLVIASLSVLLVGAMGLLAMQFRRQEKVISRTSVELEEKRRELVRVERLALAGQLSANILHDLRKPVLNIKNELQDLGAGSVAVSAGNLREQVDIFFEILRDLSLERFVRAEGEGEYVDLNDLLRRSLALVRYERGNVEVETSFGDGLKPVLAVPARLIQVFSNLILNAYQAMDGSGQLKVVSRAAGGSVVVEIADSGPGIPSENLQRVFEPFFTTKPEQAGTGLGLYISRDILREMGGQIEVESSGAGTTFRITLPVEGQLAGHG
ncbi:MAG: hypothetical protein K1X53_14020 [Candidatus Sumerlaeaceae bacterium]|nr:hypothetical protein [Candidatus Sumerlaeaceae bacterium]